MLTKLMALVALVAVGIGGLILAVRAYRPPPPTTLGVTNGSLAPCPNTPNCVSSQSTNVLSQMDPIPFTGSADAAQARLRQIVRAMPRTEILADQPGYLWVLFRSRVFDFKDDVEFSIDESAGVIHFRAAARLGRSDMGVNRARMDEIERAFRQQ